LQQKVLLRAERGSQEVHDAQEFLDARFRRSLEGIRGNEAGTHAERGTFTWLQTVSTLPPDFGGDSATAEILVHPSGNFVYGSNRGHNTIAGFAIDQATGMLNPIGWTPTQG